MENLRLSKNEQEAIRAKSIEINKKLVEKGKAPYKESELIHIILKETIRKLMVDETGEVKIQNDKKEQVH